MDDQVVAVVVLDTKQSSKYTALEWKDREGRPACIHRLAVYPEYQGRGLGKQLHKKTNDEVFNDYAKSKDIYYFLIAFLIVAYAVIQYGFYDPKLAGLVQYKLKSPDFHVTP
ncbi:GNAT family N-acetyltransferase [Paenibacillus alginolyticus]|uniref:GNAT family N-acetyltransferase n=3 Tax=Paenibacillus alginolyticus TaxID=59839 RepID=A0ABT4G9C8_9BACL|nr:GNAT family N-acetyltransferase [Paenibacillus alginolyticus]MCY9692791.1 GNAT family N-acetyltransferase [Paenibacillus alginolyticus]